MTGNLRCHVHPDPERLAAALADSIAASAARALSARGRYLIVLTGGSTPRPLYARLARLDTQWARWRIFFGDERCVPSGDAQRNDAMAREIWLDRVPIPGGNVHAIPAERGPELGADRYNDVLRGVGSFDTTLLGLGKDGHVASLFPGHGAGLARDAPDAIPVRGSPKPPPERVSLSARRLRLTRELVLLATGSGKRTAAEGLARRDPALPASHVVADGAEVWLDAAAGERLRSVECARSSGRTES